MPAVPLKPQYRPTLAQLLAPAWRRASRAGRTLTIAAAVALLVGVAGLVLTLLPAHISYAGPVPYGFSYRDLHRVAPDAGGEVKVERRGAHGRLLDSFAVAPLTLPSYTGELSGELPLYAVSYIRALARRYPGFELRGEGKTHLNLTPAYNIYYSLLLAGHRMYGRDVLIVPGGPGARAGVAIAMLASPRSSAQATSPLLVATAGVLYEPLHTFGFD